MSVDKDQIPADGGSSGPSLVSEEAVAAAMKTPNLVASVSTSQLPRLAYNVREAAEILGVSEKSVRRLIIRRLLRPSRALRHLLIPKKEIERFLEETA